MRHRRSAVSGLTATVIFLTACAHSNPSPLVLPGLDRGPLVVDVANLNWWDMEVVLEAEGARIRLGTAPSYGCARFRLSPWKLGGASWIRVTGIPIDTGREPFGSFMERGRLATRVVELTDRQTVHWTVGSDETTTELVVRHTTQRGRPC